jgi:S-DNA-T family DNA segregation ATPase FtsK/SpoIIIE
MRFYPILKTAKGESSQVQQTDTGSIKLDIDKLKSGIEQQKKRLESEIRILAKEATDQEQIAATLPWKEVSPLIFRQGLPCKPILPSRISLGHLCHKRLSYAQKISLTYPALLALSKRSGVFFRSPNGGGGKSEDLLQATALRVLCSLPLGLVRFHSIDLRARGRAFSILNALDPTLAPSAPATPELVTKFFKEMEQHVVTITRRCLTRYEWLCDFNAANPEAAEPYHFICLSGYKNGFEEASVKLVKTLIQDFCAARCGIYFLMSSQEGAEFSELVYIFADGHRFGIVDEDIDTSETGKFAELMLLPDTLPENSHEIVDWFNLSLKENSNQKKVFISVAEQSIWTLSAANGVSIPIGKTGRETIFFNFGNEDVVHHALIGGSTGAGKTVLLHNIILNGADLYSPEDLQMILMDFKEGTEFACYESLPHMRVLSVASELNFGHNVFEWLVAERMRRAGLFKKVGAANLGDYMSKSGLKMPRLLVIIDEFQRILSDPTTGSQVSLLLDDIVRTGRSFGINLILSTQSLANVHLESSTLTSLGLRICMRLSEQEATRFLNYDNALPAGFNRVGQAVYNDAEGRKEGNTEFQVGFVEVFDIAARCGALKQREIECYGKTIVETARVFHGEMPVDPSKSLPETGSDHLEAFIGEPLKLDVPPVAVKLEQKDGANLIAIAQSFDILNTLSNNLAVQFLQRSVIPNIFVIDSFPLAKERWAWALKYGAKLLNNTKATNEALDILIAELETRKLQETENCFSSWVLFLIEPQGAKAFPVSTTGEISPAGMKIQSLLDQGSRHGIHIILISSRLTRTDKVLGNFGPLTLQPFSIRIAFKSEEASNLIYDSSTKTIGNYSGILSDESTGEITPFQIYDNINAKP